MKRRAVKQWIVASLCLLAVSGCFNGINDSISYHLGDVSLGQQLIDLKKALEAGAIDQAEYEQLREEIMDLYTPPAPEEEETAADAPRSAPDAAQADGFSWF